jgi:hypothetical protein
MGCNGEGGANESLAFIPIGDSPIGNLSLAATALGDELLNGITLGYDSPMGDSPIGF